MPDDFINGIIKNTVDQIKYRETIILGEIKVDNGDGTYGVEINQSGKTYPNVETAHYGDTFAIGEIAIITYEYGNKEMPRIWGHAKKIAQNPVEVEVDYSGSGGDPITTVTTLDAYLKTSTTAYVEGKIELSNGAGNCTRRGFHYGLTIAYGSNSYDDGDYGEGYFNKQITGLTAGITYHFQAFVIDANGDEQVGGDKTMITKNPGACLYCGGHRNPPYTIFKLQISDMVKVGESVDYGHTLRAITVLNDYIYCGGSGIHTVWKIRISDMVKVGEIDYGGTILALVNDGTYVYCGGITTQKVWKIDPTNMSKVGESVTYGDISALTVYGGNIYCGGGTPHTVWKIRISDMVKVGESADYVTVIYALANDGTYVYCGGSGIQKVWKIRISDMVKVGESADYGQVIKCLSTCGDYIYCGGLTNKVWKIRISDMVKVGEIDYGNYPYALVNDGTYVYCGGSGIHTVWKIRISDMVKVGESPEYDAGAIYALAI